MEWREIIITIILIYSRDVFVDGVVERELSCTGGFFLIWCILSNTHILLFVLYSYGPHLFHLFAQFLITFYFFQSIRLYFTIRTFSPPPFRRISSISAHFQQQSIRHYAMLILILP